MAILTALPTELLEQVFYHLETIEDVHHFIRACKATYHITRRDSTYIQIMRSVIHRSPAYRHDIQLSRLLKMHSDIVERGRPIRTTHVDLNSAQNTQPNDWEHRLLCAIVNEPGIYEIDDEGVHDILTRWQGLRLLQDMWLERQLIADDFLAINDTDTAKEIIEAYNRACDREHDGVYPIRSTLEAKFYTELNADQKGRFHAAVTGLWLLNEIQWILTNFIHEPNTFSPLLIILDKCKEHIAKQSQTPVLDDLDRYAMHSFLYQHLLPIHSQVLADQCSSKLPLTFQLELEKNTIYSTRLLRFFLASAQIYLQPPDIIDLVVRDRIHRKPPYTLLRLPDSTRKYMRSTCARRFLPGKKLLSATFFEGYLYADSIRHFGLIQGATIAQSALRPAQMGAQAFFHPTYSVRSTSLHFFTDDDFLSKWLEDKAMKGFDLSARREGRGENVKDIFQKQWSTVRWMVWWWAASEEKARTKMATWRDEGS